MVGISHKQLDIDRRSNIHVSLQSIRKQLGDQSPENMVVLATCNRLEVYALMDNVIALQSVFPVAEEKLITYSGEEAISHLFRVACGLESQLLGDTQIIGQIRKAYRTSRSMGFTNGKLEQVFDMSIRTSKDVKNKTNISRGVTSFSYAAVKRITELFGDKSASLALVGTGEIGQATLKNIKKYLPNIEIHVYNRTFGKSVEMAREFNVVAHPIEDLAVGIEKADIAVLASGCPNYILTSEKFSKVPGLIIDLGVPHNAEPDLRDETGVLLVDMDDLKKQIERTEGDRLGEKKKAEQIINNHLLRFLNKTDNRWNKRKLAA